MLGKLFKKTKPKQPKRNNDNSDHPSHNHHNGKTGKTDDYKHQISNMSPERSMDDMDYTDDQTAKKRAKVKVNKRHSHIALHSSAYYGKKKLPVMNENKKLMTNSSTSTTAAHLMSSAQTNQRLQQLMGMRSGKDSKYRARSVNYRAQKQKSQGNKYPKKRRTEVHNPNEPRRHSMVPAGKEDGSHEKHLKDRRNTQTSKKNKTKKVQYRVKNEIFVLYDYYQPVRIIGSGAYAIVCEALNTITGKKCAIKKNKGVFDHITDARRILREIKLMMHFDHQDIISLIDVIPCEAHEIDTYNDCYLVMPKMETTLAKVIRSKQKLTDKHYQFFVYQMLRGLKYMHSANVIHRDLKPENILINGADCNVKITDFGLARGVCKDPIEKPTEYVVTRWYRSPEVMCSAGFYDEKVDLWSLGCIFAELILRRPLFPGQNYLDQLKIIFETMGTPKDFSWIKTPEAKRWVKKLQVHDGKPFETVFEFASEKALQLLSMMLIMDPVRRADAEELMRNSYFKDLYREEDEEECPPFDLSFEFEKSIKTKFGVRHMMFDALLSFDKTKTISDFKHDLKRNEKRGKNCNNNNGHVSDESKSKKSTGGRKIDGKSKNHSKQTVL